jgi:hypothetical protein
VPHRIHPVPIAGVIAHGERRCQTPSILNLDGS